MSMAEEIVGAIISDGKAKLRTGLVSETIEHFSASLALNEVEKDPISFSLISVAYANILTELELLKRANDVLETALNRLN